MCTQCNSEISDNECSCHEEIVSIQQSTDDVFFQSCNINDKLDNLKLSLGTDLTTILKKIDFKFGDNANTVNFSAFNLLYLLSKYPITTIKQFTEAVSLEFGDNKALINTLNGKYNTQQNSITTNFNLIQEIKTPGLLDNAGVGFTVNDDIKTVLQKIVNKFNNLSGNNFSLINITTESSDSVILTATPTTTGKKLKATVKLSSAQNNAITQQADGLYVNRITSTTVPQLELVTGNKIGIIGSNAVELPIAGIQRLTVTGNKISISGGNEETLPSLTESALVVNDSGSIRINQASNNNHNITANAIISANTNNRLSVSSDGLLVTMNATDVLNQISSTISIKEAFNILVNQAVANSCFKWAVENKGTTTLPINYIDLNGIAQTVNLPTNTSLDLAASKLLEVQSATLLITFQGKC